MALLIFLNTSNNFYNHFLINMLQIFLIIHTHTRYSQTNTSHTDTTNKKILKGEYTGTHYYLPYLKQTLLDSNISYSLNL